MQDQRRVAYFTMEIGIQSGIPTYSGGLGVLAGDTIRSGADLAVPMLAVSLLHRKGYFFQKFDANGWQGEEPVEWDVSDRLDEMPEQTSVIIEGREVQVRAWRYEVEGVTGYKVPVYFLDTDLPENSEWDRKLTDHLYGGDNHYRLCQEIILGIAGVKILRALGYDKIERFHMNEGHAAFLTIALVNEALHANGNDKLTDEVLESVRRKCIFTTHTPVAAGHDRFPMEMVEKALGHNPVFAELRELYRREDRVNMTYLALNLSNYINGVAKKHGEISQKMFADHEIDSITNGVHAATWMSPPMAEIMDRYIPDWREDNFSLRSALGIPKKEVWAAHVQAKTDLLRYVNREDNVGMDIDVLTLGFARRAATYKRGDLLFKDLERLKKINSEVGRFQVVFAGKAHPSDNEGKNLIHRIFQAKELLKDDIKIVFLENYDMELGRLITAGVDVWLNTPHPPYEASGTSGMKAALNGVPSLSVLDGWWIEGHLEGATGWAFGADGTTPQDQVDHSSDAEELYEKLEKTVIPTYYNNRNRFVDIMRHSIALNGSFFNTQRMMQQYVLRAYFR